MKQRLSKFLLASLLLTAGLFFGITATAQARVPDSDGNVHYAANETVDRTLFAAGRQITIDASVEGDVFCAGQHVTVTGHVSGDIICAAQTIVVTGQVDGDVRLAAQSVTLSGHVDGNMSAAGQTVGLDVPGGVDGDVSLAGNDITINGTVGRDISAAGAHVYLNGKVGRNVEVAGEQLSLGRLANVAGNVNYQSRQDARREQGATITGKLARHDPPVHDNSKAAGAAFGFNLFMVVAMLVTALVLALLLSSFFWKVSDIADRKPGKTFLVGLASALVAPVLVVTLMLTLVGIPLGILALLIWMIMVFMSGPVAAFALGRALFKNSTSAVPTMLGGAVVIAALYLIPIINIITMILVGCFGLGALVRYLWGLRNMPAVSLADATTATTRMPKAKATTTKRAVTTKPTKTLKPLKSSKKAE